ncbi:vWA domain-containing protein [Stieleria varia]|uniref:von Willebrand factor n=1 Tax=Stieleria varia TaxID=2528005 RepID=A0A5C6A8K8_9BACT|nr:von Willebrand factor type A domain-containing protein [Stieleria varia]TWT94623.1 von Willebrand factor [Stieleria varia]
MNEERQPTSIDPEIEARIVALVLGEASDFESDELNRLIQERPELARFKWQMQSVHGLLNQVGEGEFVGTDEDWKLSSEKRERVLATIRGETPVELPVKITLASHDRKAWTGKQWLMNLSKIAAVICMIGLLGSILVYRRTANDLTGGTRMSATIDPPLLQDVGSELQWDEATTENLFVDEYSDRNAGFRPKLSVAASDTDAEPSSKTALSEIRESFEANMPLSGSTSPPSPYYLQDDVQYYPANPAFQIAQEPTSTRGEARDGVSPSTEAKPSGPVPSFTDGPARFESGKKQWGAAAAEPQNRWFENGANGPQVVREESTLSNPQEAEEVASAGKDVSAWQSITPQRRVSLSDTPSEDKSSSVNGAQSPPTPLVENMAGREFAENGDGSQGSNDSDGDSLPEQIADRKVAPKVAPKVVAQKDFSDLSRMGDSGLSGSGLDGESLDSKSESRYGRSSSTDQPSSLGIPDVSLPESAELSFSVPMAGDSSITYQRGSEPTAEKFYRQATPAPAKASATNQSSESMGEPPQSVIKGLMSADVDYSEMALEQEERSDDFAESASSKLSPPAKPNAVEEQGLDALSDLESNRRPAIRGHYSGEVQTLREESKTLSRSAGEAQVALEAERAARNYRYETRPYFKKLLEDDTRLAPTTRRAAPAGLNEKSAAQESFSTFSLHVSDVSFKLAFAALLRGEWPDPAKIRIEEFVNAFNYGDPMPSQDEKVACRIEQSIHPFIQQRNLLRISMRTAATGRSSDTPLRLTFLLDNSGSMERVDRQQTVRRAFAVLARQLQPSDQVTLISFARQPRLLADKVSGDQAQRLVQLIDELPSEGGTNVEAALQLAIEKAREQQAEGAQNRIILLTDGAVNLGDADPESLSKMIIDMRGQGIAFDAAGISAEGLNDEVLEALTRKGDGRYYLLDSIESVDDGFARQIAGALRPSAKNVKVQVEFNPKRVGSYKLLGFEKHILNKEDFRNDKVDAAEMAAAEAGVAMYQFEPLADGEGDIGSVSVRFRDLSSGQMIENRWPIPYQSDAPRIDQAAPSIRIAASAALLAAKLRGEPLGETVDLQTLSNLISGLPDPERQDNRVKQLKQMIDQARQLSGR